MSSTIGFRLNNPANLRGQNVPWYGKTGFESGFSKFSHRDYGVAALHTDLSAKLSKGVNTIYKIIHMFAPKADKNDPDGSYIPFVVKNTGIPKDSILRKDDLPIIMRAIMQMETGTNLRVDQIISIVNAVNLEKSQKKK